MRLSERVHSLLDASHIPHALIGASALASLGVVRSTLDVDFLTTDARALDAGVWAPLRTDDTEVDIRRGDHDDPLAGVVRLSMPEERPVDLIVGRHAWQSRAVDRARVLPSGTRVVLPRDLVLLKLFAGGKHDMWDIEQLLTAVAEPSLLRDIDADLPDLPPDCRGRWSTFLRSR